jgi:hypothetical protein
VPTAPRACSTLFSAKSRTETGSQACRCSLCSSIARRPVFRPTRVRRRGGCQEPTLTSARVRHNAILLGPDTFRVVDAFRASGSIRVKERSRPPGLDQIAGGRREARGRLALGLFAIPLLGLALLTKGSPGTANGRERSHPDARRRRAARRPDPTPSQGGPTEPGGPSGRRIEQALQEPCRRDHAEALACEWRAAPNGPRADAAKAARPRKPTSAPGEPGRRHPPLRPPCPPPRCRSGTGSSHALPTGPALRQSTARVSG